VPDVIDWLLDSDPAIRWQAMRNLTDASPDVVAVERARGPYEGIGAKILQFQAEDGAWRRNDVPDWLPTLVTMQFLRLTEVDPADPAVQSAVGRLERGFRWAEEFGAKPFSEGEVEPCINGNALAAASYFGYPSERLAQRLVGEQLEDGGWNCEAPKSSRSSFHSTICALEGLLEYERAAGPSSDMTAARRRGEEYLLARALFRRLSTGEIIDPEFLNFGFPPRYCYDVLRALEYFRTTGSTPDARMREATGVIERKRQPDGRWLLDATHNEALPFRFNEEIEKPSRWITLRAMRVLGWYEVKNQKPELEQGHDAKRAIPFGCN
jgi:hypothetical protein